MIKLLKLMQMKLNHLLHGEQIHLWGLVYLKHVPYAADYESESDKQALEKALALYGA